MILAHIDSLQDIVGLIYAAIIILGVLGFGSYLLYKVIDALRVFYGRRTR